MSIASGTTLVVATSLLVSFAVSADGYRKHDAELNDGGVWVVNGELGMHGRINKPINQLDGVVPDARDDLELDVVQDGAAVVAVNRDAASIQSVDPSQLVMSADGGVASLPASGDLQMLGGTLASLDARTGAVWVSDVDPVVGIPSVSAVDKAGEPAFTVGAQASLAVSAAGTVVAVSAEKSRITLLPGAGAAQEDRSLSSDAGSPTAVTTVGEQVVTLDAGTGQLAVLDGPHSTVPAGAVLQQPGPSADAVLLATADSLLEVDLESGESRTVASGVSGRPVEPVRLGACSYGAWGGGTVTSAVRCGDGEASVKQLTGGATSLAFRVNRTQIVLNDALSGAVWDLDLDTPLTIANWDDFTSNRKKKNEDEKDDDKQQGDRRPPKAEPDTYGVRPGATTVLHPLDNDSAPDGRLLSIVGVDAPGGDAEVTISPDGQTLQLSAPSTLASTSFKYHINDGRKIQASATVTVHSRTAGQDESPTLRKGHTDRTWQVAAGGTVAVPVLSDWRDDADGDALVLEQATTDAEGPGSSARTTADGRVRFTAPANGSGVVTATYSVGDGRGAPVEHDLSFQVMPAEGGEAVAATAEPDVIRGQAGRPIVIRPLANDLPGADPSTQAPELALGGELPEQDGLRIATDVVEGEVTVVADEPGVYLLDYDVAYGNAPLGKGKIRVDVLAAPKSPQAPVVMSDSITLYGQAPAAVDLLANDVDPNGGLLVVQQVRGRGEHQMELAIVDGRWLRVSTQAPVFAPNPQVVEYTVSNGVQSAVGEVVVSHRPTPEENAPVTTPDQVTVRAGSAVTIAPLDNDLSPSGDRLTLVDDESGVAGELTVTGEEAGVDTGKAFLAGRTVRYVAPELTEGRTFTIEYVAANTREETDLGTIRVNVKPQSDMNQPPTPPTVEGRAVANDVITLRLPGAGLDPDGDPVTLTGITSAPRLGRVLSFTASTLEYQAYPDSAGTDEFTYTVTDTHGAVGTGTMRVAVVPAVAPQPPLAVDDVLTVAPGRTATFDPMANDHLAPGEEPTISLVEEADGVTLDEETGLIQVEAPDTVSAPVHVVYALSNGLHESRATLTLHTAKGVELAPVVYDAYGSSDDSDSAEADVLLGAYDPDGDWSKIRLVETYAPADLVTTRGSTVRVVRGPEPRVVPFRVEDEDGAAALASLYVPATGTGVPYVKPDALVEIDRDGTTKVSLDDVVAAPGEGDLRMTRPRGVSGSPGDVSVAWEDENTFTVTAAHGYRGPAAAMVEVTTATAANGDEDPSDPTDGATALLSVPVQVGSDTPEITCPTEPIELSAGQQLDLDLRAVCTVWTLDSRDLDTLTYSAEWDATHSDVTLEGVNGPVVSLGVSPSASTAGTATLKVRAGDSNTATLTFRLAAAPAPRMQQVPLQEVEGEESKTLDLANYVVPGVSNPSINVVSVKQLSGPQVQARAEGSRVVFTGRNDGHGRSRFAVVVSDLAGSTAPARTVQGTVEVSVAGTPGKQPPPEPWFHHTSPNVLNVDLFAPSDDGGAGKIWYEIRDEKSKQIQRCASLSCTWKGAIPDKKYTFTSRAVNRVGPGEWSDRSLEGFVESRLPAVRNARIKGAGDRYVDLTWTRPDTTYKVLRYKVNDRTFTVQSGDTMTVRMDGLVNGKSYDFRIVPVGELGDGASATVSDGVPYGTPDVPGGLKVTAASGSSDTAVVGISWQRSGANGMGPVRYTVEVSRPGTSGYTQVCSTTNTACQDPAIALDGRHHRYRVRATNLRAPGVDGESSSWSSPVDFEAVGSPAPWNEQLWSVEATGTSQEARLSYDVPSSRGTESRVYAYVAGQRYRINGGTGTVTDTIRVPDNARDYMVKLEVCNEHDRCQPSQEKPVGTYGRLGDSIKSVSSSADGQTITWTIVVDGNGRPATLTYSTDDGGLQGTKPVPRSEDTLTVTYAAGAWRKEVRLNFSVSDGLNRGSESDSDRETTDAPPPPTVGISKGAACNDDGDPKCRIQGGYSSWNDCTAANCARVALTVSGVQENMTCTISSRHYTEWWDVTPADQNPRASYYYYGGNNPGRVTFKCGDSETVGIDWPSP
ncbi:MAG: Ig-like domain-containing protein [Nocardioides sp.]|uniref:Ig-like domain-containing protein n=1 Tax=Nocardioides sp. TaxID=35761 RepID=UPI003F021E5B